MSQTLSVRRGVRVGRLTTFLRVSTYGFGTLIVVLSLVLLLSITLAVMTGPVPIPAGRVWSIVGQHLTSNWITVDWPAFQDTIVWDIRLPRVLLGALVGAGLAVVGTTMQALVRNPLADPYLLGVSSGASVGAVCVMLLGISLFGVYSLSLAAFAGAFAAFMLVYVLARQNGRMSTGRLMLAGVAVGYVLSAITSFLIYNADDGEQVRSVLFWMLGGLGGARWEFLTLPLVVLVVGIAWLLGQARTLNALLVGEETAASLGVDVTRFRKHTFALTSLLTGVLVAVSGGIGFVGLMLPHIVRLLVGTDHRRVLPVVALVGAIFLVWVDVLARTLVAPEEMPLGIITALLGAPFFLWLMRRNSDALGGRQ
ncbi:MAG: iron ABC transporter permease [Herpetosiphonaceae bacterium]|nr:iron ABC transporter permease [Herpetosiphonaceae bacterium]